MNGEVIKSFLVGLGFDLDEASLAKFNKAISSASVKVAALYGSVQLAATGIFYSITKMAAGFEEVGYSLRLVAPAVNKMLILRQAMLDAYKRAGMDLTKVVKESILFNYSLAKTKFALEAVYKSVGAKFFPLLTKQMDIFRLKIFANMPKIQDALTKFVNFIFKAFEATTILGARVWSILGRVYDFFKMLDEATGGWSTKILAVLAAWKLLNLGFLATPLGMLIAGFVALLALWDDFKTFQEGGESLLNWGSNTVKMVVGLTAAVAAMATVWGVATGAMTAYNAALRIYQAVQAGVNLVMMANPIGLIIAGVVSLVSLLTVLDAKWSIFGGHLFDFFRGIGGKVLDVMGGANAGANAANVAVPAPLMPQGGGVNQKVNQETNILVQGSADANAVGRSVASEQNKVNFDMTRNMRGAVR